MRAGASYWSVILMLPSDWLSSPSLLPGQLTRLSDLDDLHLSPDHGVPGDEASVRLGAQGVVWLADVI